MELPEEIWESICKFIDEDDYRFLESVSLVSTSLLGITNRVRSTFVITDRTVPLLHRHLLRFRKLKRIRFFDFSQDLNSILLQISLSGLDLEAIDVSGMSYFPDFEKLGFKNLKELNCSEVKGLSDSDLVDIGVCFPFLQKLDMNYRDYSRTLVTDSGIISLSSNLEGLLKIKFCGNNLITDKSLVSLSSMSVISFHGIPSNSVCGLP